MTGKNGIPVISAGMLLLAAVSVCAASTDDIRGVWN